MSRISNTSSKLTAAAATTPQRAALTTQFLDQQRELLNNKIEDVGQPAKDELADTGTLSFQTEKERTRRSIPLDRALAKIGQGNYGICTQCGHTIEKTRLQAIPEAEICIVCIQKQRASGQR